MSRNRFGVAAITLLMWGSAPAFAHPEPSANPVWRAITYTGLDHIVLPSAIALLALAAFSSALQALTRRMRRSATTGPLL